ncbi:hypothetical protein PR048_026854 [Dryococelus australis]|uniref:Retrovirus-related Pol polyprotein from transposon TNT 1-94 n=1 Tax=Dryococelus australis TaxID=614101 RepID=A0ABQ9GMG1_9NEOP|nr:hypothetical protein PR048_026854 [Dryococelus australis]
MFSESAALSTELLKGRENYDTWKLLFRHTFGIVLQDGGLTRKIILLRILITTKLDEYNSVEEYVNRILNAAHKLSSVCLQVSDEWTCAILLAGLPSKYEPI